MTQAKHDIKTALYAHCRDYVQSLIEDAQRGIAESREAAGQEEKSSAGDKFETHRAMMHLQMESFITRLEVAEQLAERLVKLELELLKGQGRSRVGLGALIEVEREVEREVEDQAERRWYFVAVSAPPLVIEGVSYTCLSVDAPLYLALRGLGEGDWAEWAGEEDALEVLSVL